VNITSSWDSKAGLSSYGDAVVKALEAAGKKNEAQQFRAKETTLSNNEARALAKSLGVEPYWCWDKPRAREGYYRFDGGIEACIARGKAYAPYADLIWMETKKPILSDAEHFSKEVRKVHPKALFAYNLSPSFNWDEAGLNDAAIKSLNSDLGKLGYVWQFITLAGFHSDSLGITQFTRAYARITCWRMCATFSAWRASTKWRRSRTRSGPAQSSLIRCWQPSQEDWLPRLPWALETRRPSSRLSPRRRPRSSSPSCSIKLGHSSFRRPSSSKH